MHVRFGNVDEEYIKSKVEKGFYNNENEVVRDAIRRMRELEEKSQLETLRALVMVGHKQAENGQTAPYSPELINDLTKQAFENFKKGKTIKKDVRA